MQESRYSPGDQGIDVEVSKASQLNTAQLPSFMVIEVCDKISADFLLGIATGAMASIFCIYMLTVEALLAVVMVRQEASRSLAKVAKELFDKWGIMACALKNLLQGQETFSIMKFLKGAVVQEGYLFATGDFQ